jgi:hypothetical protein
MPNYARPFAAAGGTAGAAGGSLLGGLGRLLEPLDYPRQALANLFAGVGEGIDQGDWRPALKAIPGALGAGLAGGLMATGVGAPLGVLAGSALGGTAQGLFGSEAPTPEDLAGKLGIDTNDMGGKLAAIGLGMATDPLSFAGGLGGAARGAQAGSRFGKGLEEAALWRGPRYPGGIEKLAGLAGDNERLAGHVANLQAHPDLSSILGEIQPGSSYLGHGAESIALRRPDGGVTTISRPSSRIAELLEGVDQAAPPPMRPSLSEVLQAARSRPFETTAEGVNPVRVEQLPHVDVGAGTRATDATAIAKAERQYPFFRGAQSLRSSLADKGVNFWDTHLGNVGRTQEGRYAVLDAGALEDAATGTRLPGAPEQLTPREPTRMQNALLNLLGSDKAVQREISQGVSRVPGGTGVALGQFAPLSDLKSSSPLSSALGSRVSPDALGMAQEMAMLDRAMAQAIEMKRGTAAISPLENRFNRIRDQLSQLAGPDVAGALYLGAKKMAVR